MVNIFELIEQNKNKYVIAAIGKGYAYNSVLFWGKNSCGYYADLAKCEFYTKKEAYSHATPEDIPVKVTDLIPYLGVHVEHAYEAIGNARQEYKEFEHEMAILR